MTDAEIILRAIEAAGAEINGYRYGNSGKEPAYGIPVETVDGVEYEEFVLPTWLPEFVRSIERAHGIRGKK